MQFSLGNFLLELTLIALFFGIGLGWLELERLSPYFVLGIFALLCNVGAIIGGCFGRFLFGATIGAASFVILLVSLALLDYLQFN